MVRKDFNLKIFLEYEEELAVRGKNVKEKISEFFGIVQVCHKSHNIIHYVIWLDNKIWLHYTNLPRSAIQRSIAEVGWRTPS